MRCDALAVYVDANPETIGNIASLLKGEIHSHAQWLEAMTRLYALVVLTGSDGWCFEIYTSVPANFDLLAAPLSKAMAVIEESSWYKEHEGSLEWDGDPDNCLKPRKRLDFD